jgi:RNA polymerase sigma-70 factor (ECF subfamily)
MASSSISNKETAAILPDSTAYVPDIEELYVSHARSVEHWALRLGGPKIDAEDVVQEVFLVAHSKLSGFRGDSSLSTWLFAITERVVLHRLRKERWRSWLRGSAKDSVPTATAREPSPLEALESKRATELFYSALEGVSLRYRSALVLFELDELSGQQIADLQGVRVETVWVWLHRARAQLLKNLQKLEGKR